MLVKFLIISVDLLNHLKNQFNGDEKLLFKIDWTHYKAAFDPVTELLMKGEKYDTRFSLDLERKRYFVFDFPS